jgi:hypothetical protein
MNKAFPQALGLFLGFLLIFPCGCVSKTKAKAQAKAAFLAGQQESAGRAKLAEMSAGNVTIIGPVRNPAVSWSEDLTLAKAIVAAGYVPANDPRQIVIIRNGEAIMIEPKRLLAGEDVPLLRGDVLQIQ